MDAEVDQRVHSRPMAKDGGEARYPAQGEELRKLREGVGLLQHELGEIAGVTKQAVSDWERGINRPKLDKAKAIDEALGATGQVLSLYGYDPGVLLAERLSRLEAQHEEMVAEITRLSELVIQIGKSQAASVAERAEKRQGKRRPADG